MGSALLRGTLPAEVEAVLDGYGSGDGSGSGSGSGSGYGSGDGDGYGSGSGDGSGSGSGYGSGDGSGYGSGDGDGYGSGDGYGYGYGSGDGDLEVIQVARCKIPDANDPRTLALWRSTKAGFPANGGTWTEAARPGLVQEVTGNVELCKRGLHATLMPSKWKGERIWLVALEGDVHGTAEKMVARKREILCEIPVAP